MFQDVADKWNELQSNNKTKVFANKKLERDLFYNELPEESVLLLTGAPFTGKTHTLTHYTNIYANDTTCIFYANHFSSQNIQEELLQVLNIHEIDSFNNFLLQLNGYGEGINHCISVIIDGINEAPEFDIIQFKIEFEQLQTLIKNFPYVKLLISIRQEYIPHSDNLFNHIIRIAKPKHSNIQNICSNLKIPKQVLNAMIDEPIGFYYLVADVFEKIPLKEKAAIKNLTKSRIFEKRWEQIEASCNKHYDFDTTPLMLRNKLLEYIADNNILYVTLSNFTNEEKALLDQFQKERLVSVRFERVEFQHQYYCDYYTIYWLEKNWGRKQKNIVRKVIGFGIDALWRCITPITSLGYELDAMRKETESTFSIIKDIILYKFKDSLLTYKYHNIIKNIKLSRTQHIILLEHLRECDFEMPIKDLTNKENRYLWLESLRDLSFDEIENSEKIQERISDILNDQKLDSLHMIWNKIPKKAHEIFLNLSLKRRDDFFSCVLSDHQVTHLLHKEVDSKMTQEWYHLFVSFTILHKQNELYRLVWLLALPDRELRDKSTRILINVSYKDIELFNELWVEMKNVNDPYIVERLFIIGYSILLNGYQREIQILLAKELYRFAYFNGQVYPHILIQEYGLRIYTWLLNQGIWQEPYHLQIKKINLDFIKPIKSNGVKLEEYVGISCKGSIALECEGHYGYWGRYVYQYPVTQLVDDSHSIYWELEDANIKQFDKFKANMNQSFPKFISLFSHINTERMLKEQTEREEQRRQKTRPDFSQLIDTTWHTSKKINLLEQSYKIEHQGYNVPIPLDEDNLNIFLKATESGDTQNKAYLFLGKHYIVQRIFCDYWTELDLGKEEFEQFDLYNSAHHAHRYDFKKERFTKKMQWIGMYEYMGHLRNYLGFVPHLARLESYLYFYEFSDDIQEKLLEYLFAKGIDEKLFFNTLNQSHLYIDIHTDIQIEKDNKELTTIKSRLSSHIDDELWENIIKISFQSQLQILYEKFTYTSDLCHTNDEIEYIKSKLLMDNEWLLLYGIESINDTYSMTFGSRMMIYNNTSSLVGQSSFQTPYTNSANKEQFLEPNNNLNKEYRSELFIYDSEGKSQYDHSNTSQNREILSHLLITKYNLQKSLEGYTYNHELVVKIQNGLWYIHKNFAKQVINDYSSKGKKIYWWCYFEKMILKIDNSTSYNDWRGYLRLDGNILKGKFKSYPKQNDFKINIKL